MAASPESSWLKQNWPYLFGAVLIHVLFAGVFGLTMVNMSRNAPPPSLAIQAMIVDSSQLAKAAGRPKPPEVKKPEVDPEAQAAEQRQKDEAEKREKEQQQEQERQAALKREEEQKQQDQEREVREKQEREATERKKVADAQAQAEREKAETEAKAKAEAERKRVADIQRKQKEEADRRKAADEAQSKSVREAELRRQLAEEEGRESAVNAGLLNQYVAMIQQRVERNWNRPGSARPGLECEVRVTQTPGGTVLSAQVTQCNGDAAVKQSIEAAVLRSSPLPPPSDPSLFERILLLTFKPAD